MGVVQKVQNGKDSDLSAYHRDYAKICSNFDKRTLPAIIHTQNANIPKPVQASTSKAQTTNKQEQVSEPPP